MPNNSQNRLVIFDGFTATYRNSFFGHGALTVCENGVRITWEDCAVHLPIAKVIIVGKVDL